MKKLSHLIVYLMFVINGIVYAAGGVLPGIGIEGDPYLIEDLDDFNAFCGDSSKWCEGVYTKLEADIDLASKEYEDALIGTHRGYMEYDGIPYSGVFDGNLHQINNLFFNLDGYRVGYIGVFEKVESTGMIKNLTLSNLSVIVGENSRVLGSITAFNKGVIYNCSVTGVISTDNKDLESGGGIAGVNYGSIDKCSADIAFSISRTYDKMENTGTLCGDNYGSITNSYSFSRLNSGYNLYYPTIGGLVGTNSGIISCCYSEGEIYSGGGLVEENSSKGNIFNCYSNADILAGGGGLACSNFGVILNCYATGNITGESGRYCGGLISENDGRVESCFAAGNIDGNNKCYTGGLIGYNTGGVVIDCYSTGTVINGTSMGGFIGYVYSASIISNCYWDIEVTGSMAAFSGRYDLPTFDVTGLTTDEMGQITILPGDTWDFSDETDNGPMNYWMELPGQDYPLLSFFNGYTPSNLNGSGTEADPHIITDVSHLDVLSYEPFAFYKLGNDIDLAGVPFRLAVIPAFGGSLKGDNHTINYSMSEVNLGLFGVLSQSAMVENLVVESINIIQQEAAIENIQDNSGILCGLNFGKINKCVTKGQLNIAGDCSNIGGLTGINAGIISFCNSTASITCDNGNYVGGLCGTNGYRYYYGGAVCELYPGVIDSCYAVSTIIAGEDSNYSGGLCGYNYSGELNRCYADTTITGNHYSGGLCGINQDRISNCYASGSILCDIEHNFVSGLVGTQYQESVIKNCYSTTEILFDNVYGLSISNAILSFWDIEASGCLESGGGFGCTTAQMKQAATYLGWGDDWTIDEGNDYPRLVWENERGVPLNNIPVRTYAGSGAIEDPFIIDSADDFYCLSQLPEDWDKRFELITDVDMSEIADFYPPSDFGGCFDGNGYTVHNLTINAVADNIGLFGYINESGEVRNLNICGVNITGNDGVGAIAGCNYGKVFNCHSTGSISGNSLVGGICGLSSGYMKICSSSCNVTGYSSVGGIAGYCSNVSRCYATGSAIGAGDSSKNIGGFCGDGENISDCYATGNVSGYKQIGGFIGVVYEVVQNCYSTGIVTGTGQSSTVGGFCGAGDPVVNCYWDIETSGTDTSSGGTGKTTVQMQTLETFNNDDIYESENRWDFTNDWFDGNDDYWDVCDGSYPKLTWSRHRLYAGQGTEADPYLIENFNQLFDMRLHPNDWYKHFRLTNNIQLCGRYNAAFIAPVDRPDAAIPFNGIFDGNGHKIYNLTIMSNTNEYLGFIGLAGYKSEIRNLGIEPVVIASDSIYVKSSSVYVGGLVAYNCGIIERCYVRGEVTGKDTVGLLTGKNDFGSIDNCYAIGKVSGEEYVGGFCGINNSQINNCYSSVLAGDIASNAGFCYRNNGVISNSFWDSELGQTDHNMFYNGSTAATTIEMQTESTFTSVGWDFADNDGNIVVWEILDGEYPHLEWEEFGYLTGNGSEQEPYLIESIEDFDFFANAIYAERHWSDGVHTRLMSNIDFKDRIYGRAIIADAVYDDYPYTVKSKYCGIFDGNNHTISNMNIIADGISNSYLGLFGNISSNGLVKDIKIENASIKTNLLSENIGLMCGDNQGEIENCKVSGAINTIGIDSVGATHPCNLGGVCGINSGLITRCSVNSEIEVFSGSRFGGFCGNNAGDISCSFASGSIYFGPFSSWEAGFVGDNRGNIENCFTSGIISGYSFSGFVGGNSGSISNCYSAKTFLINSSLYDVSSFCYFNYSGTITSCFWDSDVANDAISFQGTGKTTAEMQKIDTFITVGWDFNAEAENGTEDIWHMPFGGSGYPMLWWCKDIPGDIAGGYGVDMQDAAAVASSWMDVFTLPDLAEMSVFWLVGK